MAVNLNLSQPVFDPPTKETVKQAELSYIEKPIIPETQITIVPVKKALFTNAEKLYQSPINNCVEFAKQETGIYRTMGAGGRLAINSHEYKDGIIGSLVGSPHAVVTESKNNGLITFRESNYEEDWITRRTLPESQFIGFIH